MSQSVLFIGGTGAQGSAVVKALAEDPKFILKVLTRNANAPAAQRLLNLSDNISLIEGDCFDEGDLRKAFADIDSCYVNIQGFATGEKSEIYWGIRTYEIAFWAGVQHFVWSGLDYCSKKAGFDPKYKCHHYDAKGKVQGKNTRNSRSLPSLNNSYADTNC
jgi:NAD(P)-dependent dehydrogenase (short-subunit alcohol dehydrogenase family)